MKKKLICFVLFFTMIAGVFAQEYYEGDLTEDNIEKKGREKSYDWLTFGAWGRGAVSPLIVYSDEVDADGEKVKDSHYGKFFTGVGSTRGSYAFEQEFYLTGEFDYVGFQLGLSFDGGTDDNGGSVFRSQYWYNYLGAAIWVKPIGNDYLKITGGMFEDRTLRGKIGEVNDGFEEFVLPNAPYEDSIFEGFGQHYSNTGNLGFMISSEPIEGLFIGARVNAPGIWLTPANQLIRAEDAFRNIQVGVGYEIPNVGHVRVQYLGGYVGKNVGLKRIKKYMEEENPADVNGLPDREWLPAFGPHHGHPASIQAAFAFTRLDNLLVDIGFKSYLPTTSGGTLEFPTGDYVMPYTKSFKGFVVGAAASYSIAGFSITGRIDSAFGAYRRVAEDDKNLYDASSSPLTVDLRLVPKYDLGFMEVGLDFAFNMEGNEIDVNGDPLDPSKTVYRWGIGAFIQRSFNFGFIKVGVTYTSPPIYENKDQKAVTAYPMIHIPIILGYSF